MAKAKTRKYSPGRPPFKITREVLKKAEGFGARGMTNKQIAEALGLHPGTLSKFKGINNDFKEAIQRGQARGIAEITNSLFVNAKAGNLGAQVFYLKNRAGWADKQDIDVKGTINKIDVTFIDPDAT